MFSDSLLDAALVSLSAGTSQDVSLKSSFGLAAQIGADIALSNDWFVNFDLKYINIETEAQINTTAGVVIRTDVDINPYVFGVGIGRPF